MNEQVIWEYDVETFDEFLNERESRDMLNEKGGYGWELVAVSPSLRTFIFKRVKNENIRT